MIGPVVILSPSPAVFHSRIQNRFLVAEMTSKMCYRAPFFANEKLSVWKCSNNKINLRTTKKRIAKGL